MGLIANVERRKKYGAKKEEGKKELSDCFLEG